MSGRAVHFAITDDDVAKLQKAPDAASIIEIITEEIEERWEKEQGLVAETDKAWDGIHRCLTNGLLEYESGELPLKLCILGGTLVCDEGLIVCYVQNGQLPELSAALRQVTKKWFREQYFKIPPEDYEFEIGDEDFEYIWNWFEGLPGFFERAQESGRHVIFTVDL